MRQNGTEKFVFAYQHTSRHILPQSCFTEMREDWTTFVKSGDKPGNYGITLVDNEFHVIKVTAKSKAGDPIAWELTGKRGDIERAATWALILQDTYDYEQFTEWKRRLNEKLIKGGCRPV